MTKSKVKFRTKYQRARELSEAGTHFIDEYGLEVVDDELVLNVVGQTNVYDKIQANRDSGNINLLIARFNAGDDDAFNQLQGAYFDATELPKSYVEIYAKLKECENVFDHLPPEVKEKFNNSHIEFWNSFDEPSFFEKLNDVKSYQEFIKKENSDDNESEVTNNES